MMTVPLPNPLLQPIAFLMTFLVYYVYPDPILGVLKIALFSTVLMYPFLLIGDKVYTKLKNQIRIQPVIIWYITGFLMTAIFWLIIRIWSSLLGGEVFMTGTITEIAVGWFLGSIFILVFGMFGHWLLRKMEHEYEMPHYISYLIISYVLNVIGWTIIVGKYFV